MQNILSSIQIEVTRDEAAEVYQDYILEELVVSEGSLVQGVDAFNVDMAKEIRLENDERNAPLYVAEKDGKTFYVIPLRGAGLWGPIWGYISLEEDLNTVYGAVSITKETPGLGAEIKYPIFTEQFRGKKILDDQGNFLGIDVRKGGSSTDYEVDGISGGTITSDGVELMILDCLKSYFPFLKEYAGTTATAQLNN